MNELIFWGKANVKGVPRFGRLHQEWKPANKIMEAHNAGAQLFRTCERCDGTKRAYYTDSPDEQDCHTCDATGKVHIDLAIEQLERLTELMREIKPTVLMHKGLPMYTKEYNDMVAEYNQAQQEIKTLIG